MTSRYCYAGSANNAPLLCICIPTYNAAKTIGDSLVSVLNQTYSNLIIHIVDNASTDDTLKIVESFSDSRIRIHSHNVNIGAEGNFNRCIQVAEGKYTAIYHADDIYGIEMASKQVAHLEANSEVGAVFTAARKIDAQGKSFGIIGEEDSWRVSSELNFQSLFKNILKRGNFLVCPSAMVRTNIYKNEIKSWRGDLFRSSADLDVWLRVADKHLIGFLSEPLMSYRIDSSQFSNSVRLRTTKADFFLVIDYYLRLNKVKSFLTSADVENYQLLLVNDEFWRAINLYVVGDFLQASALVKNILQKNNAFLMLERKRDFLILFLTIFLYFLLLLKFNYCGKLLINFMRKKFNK